MKQDNPHRALSMAPVHGNSGEKMVVVAVIDIVEVVVTLEWPVTLKAA